MEVEVEMEMEMEVDVNVEVDVEVDMEVHVDVDVNVDVNGYFHIHVHIYLADTVQYSVELCMVFCTLGGLKTSRGHTDDCGPLLRSHLYPCGGY